MKRSGWFIVGIASGAAAGLLLAPQSGRRTRALVRDKSVKYSHDVADFTGKKSKHIANKVKGYAHEVKSTVTDRLPKKESVEEAISAS